MKYLFIIFIAITMGSCVYPKLGETIKYCHDCNHSNGMVFFKKKWRNITQNSFGERYFIYRHRKVFIQRKVRN